MAMTSMLGDGSRAGSAARMLALDLGSSSVRALVLDERLVPVPGAKARRGAHITQAGDGSAALDADGYLAAVCECLDELSAAGALADVAVVALSSQWHSLLPLDSAGRPVGPGMSWMDLRPTAPPGSGPGDPVAYHARTGAWWHPFYWPVKLRWLAGQGGTAARFAGLPEYVTAALLGETGASVSSASGTGALDTERCVWDPEALDLAGVPESAVPALLPDDWRGRLLPDYARRWPALADAEWAAPLGDGAASALGGGATAPDRLAITVGTSAAVRFVCAGAPAPPPTVWRYRVDRRRSVLGVAYSAGGVLYDWLTDVLRGPAGKITDAELDALAPGAHGLVSLPFHAGHRAPAAALGAGGTLHGLRLTTTALDIAAATMEGVCHEIAAGAAVLNPARDATATLGGGAVSASPWFARRLAAALGGVLDSAAARVATDAEVGARGAAACATGRVYEPETTEIRATRSEVAAMADAADRHHTLRVLLPPDLP